MESAGLPEVSTELKRVWNEWNQFDAPQESEALCLETVDEIYSIVGSLLSSSENTLPPTSEQSHSLGSDLGAHLGFFTRFCYVLAMDYATSENRDIQTIHTSVYRFFIDASQPARVFLKKILEDAVGAKLLTDSAKSHLALEIDAILIQAASTCFKIGLSDSHLTRDQRREPELPTAEYLRTKWSKFQLPSSSYESISITSMKLESNIHHLLDILSHRSALGQSSMESLMKAMKLRNEIKAKVDDMMNLSCYLGLHLASEGQMSKLEFPPKIVAALLVFSSQLIKFVSELPSIFPPSKVHTREHDDGLTNDMSKLITAAACVAFSGGFQAIIAETE